MAFGGRDMIPNFFSEGTGVVGVARQLTKRDGITQICLTK